MIENVSIVEMITAVGGLMAIIFGKNVTVFLSDVYKAFINRKNSNIGELEKKITKLKMECNLKDQENLNLEKSNFEMNYKLKNIIPALRIMKDDSERNELLDILDPTEKNHRTSART